MWGIVGQRDEWKPLQAWSGIQEVGAYSLEKQLPSRDHHKPPRGIRSWCWTWCGAGRSFRGASGVTIPDPLRIRCCLCILRTPVMFSQLRAQALVIENLFLFLLKVQAASQSEPRNASWIKRRKALRIIQRTISGQQSRKKIINFVCSTYLWWYLITLRRAWKIWRQVHCNSAEVNTSVSGEKGLTCFSLDCAGTRKVTETRGTPFSVAAKA